MTGALVLVMPEAQAEAAMELLDERQAAKLDMMAREVHQILEASTQTVIGSTADEARLNDYLGRAAKAVKELEALRRQRVDPLNREVKQVNAIVAKLTDPLEAFTATGKRLVAAWHAQERSRVAREQEEARRRQEEAARLEAEALCSGDDAAFRAGAVAVSEALLSMPLPAPTGIKSDQATTTVRERWVFSVVEPDKVPLAYLSVDERKIRSAIVGGVREIPGVAISLEDQVVVRSR